MVCVFRLNFPGLEFRTTLHIPHKFIPDLMFALWSVTFDFFLKCLLIVIVPNSNTNNIKSVSTSKIDSKQTVLYIIDYIYVFQTRSMHYEVF